MNVRFRSRPNRPARCLVPVVAVLATTMVAAAPPDYRDHQDLLYYLDASGRRHAVRTVDDWKIRKAHVLAHMQTVMGPLPKPEKPVPLDVQVVETARLDGLVRRKITYHTDSRERRVPAYLFLPAGVDSRDSSPAPGSRARPRCGPERLPAVLCLHQTTRIGKAEPAGLGGNPNLHYALHLARRGYVTLAPDYPSFGEYEYQFTLPHDGEGQGGSRLPQKPGISQEGGGASRYLSGTMKAIYDNIRAVDLLQSLPEVDPQRIGVIGHSLGGHNAMFTAAFEPRIKAVVSNCGFTRFPKYYGGRLKGWTSGRYMPLIASRYGNDPDRVPFDFPEIIGCFAPRPFLASAPLKDSNFEVSGVKDSIRSARPVYRLFGRADNLQANYPDCGHDFPLQARRVAYEFLDRHLKRNDE